MVLFPTLHICTFVYSGLVECNGQSEWQLVSVVDNSQHVSLFAVEEAKQEEGARDNVKTVKLGADGETDRVLMEKGNWREGTGHRWYIVGLLQ